MSCVPKMSQLQQANRQRQIHIEMLACSAIDTDTRFTFRWQRLPGKIPGTDELRAKMSQLHK